MSWLKYYELIVMGNGLIVCFLDDFVKNNDFEINGINWCIGVRNCEKPLAGNAGQKCLEVEDGKITVWSLICENYSLVLKLWKKLQIDPWCIIRDSGQYWGWIMGKISV
jgi:hypothetical protein